MTNTKISDTIQTGNFIEIPYVQYGQMKDNAEIVALIEEMLDNECALYPSNRHFCSIFNRSKRGNDYCVGVGETIIGALKDAKKIGWQL